MVFPDREQHELGLAWVVGVRRDSWAMEYFISQEHPDPNERAFQGEATARERLSDRKPRFSANRRKCVLGRCGVVVVGVSLENRAVWIVEDF